MLHNSRGVTHLCRSVYCGVGSEGVRKRVDWMEGPVCERKRALVKVNASCSITDGSRTWVAAYQAGREGGMQLEGKGKRRDKASKRVERDRHIDTQKNRLNKTDVTKRMQQKERRKDIASVQATWRSPLHTKPLHTTHLDVGAGVGRQHCVKA